MKLRLSPTLVLLLALTAVSCGQGQQPAPGNPPATNEARFTGLADASAGVSLGGDWFVAATDEFNTLSFHRWSLPGKPLKTLDLNAFLGIDPQGKSPEADIESLARIGDTVYAITSHGRNKDGKYRPNRHRFFALKATDAAGDTPPSLEGLGKPFAQLAEAIAAAPEFSQFKLADTLQLATDKKGKIKDYVPLAPKDEGFNIEGLAASPDGHLLIGLRNPTFQAKAVLLPLTNPREVTLNDAAPAFGQPVLLNLGGRAIRSIEWLPQHQAYGISAGPSGSEGSFAFYLWKGKGQDAPREVALPHWPKDNFKSEALFADSSGKLFFLSDDGTLPINGAEQKSLPPAEQSFRGFSCEFAEGK